MKVAYTPKNCRFDENYSINDKIISVFEMISLRLKNNDFQRSSPRHCQFKLNCFQFLKICT